MVQRYKRINQARQTSYQIAIAALNKKITLASLLAINHQPLPYVCMYVCMYVCIYLSFS